MQVFVYFNLHKKCWSVRHKGKVILHTDDVSLKNVTFKVSKAGRERVLRERKKNVHAGVEGELVDTFYDLIRDVGVPVTPVTYNPYNNASFINTDTQEPVGKADAVTMYTKRKHKVIALNPR